MLTNMLRILAASLHFGLVVRLWEVLFLASDLGRGSVRGVEELKR